ncbi:hypothetical protein Tco_0267809 [Tanacetum coccineum]
MLPLSWQRQHEMGKRQGQYGCGDVPLRFGGKRHRTRRLSYASVGRYCEQKCQNFQAVTTAYSPVLLEFLYWTLQCFRNNVVDAPKLHFKYLLLHLHL